MVIEIVPVFVVGTSFGWSVEELCGGGVRVGEDVAGIWVAMAGTRVAASMVGVFVAGCAPKRQARLNSHKTAIINNMEPIP